MAENISEYFSSVLIREYISALPVPEATFEGRESCYLRQLIVTQQMVAKNIMDNIDNTPPGMDGIPPKLLSVIVEQIRIPLATVLSVSIEGRVVPLELKEANTKLKSKNHTPVNVTSVICKLL